MVSRWLGPAAFAAQRPNISADSSQNPNGRLSFSEPIVTRTGGDPRAPFA